MHWHRSNRVLIFGRPCFCRHHNEHHKRSKVIFVEGISGVSGRKIVKKSKVKQNICFKLTKSREKNIIKNYDENSLRKKNLEIEL